MRRSLLLATSVLLVVSACGGDEDGAGEPVPTEAAPGSATPAATSPVGTLRPSTDTVSEDAAASTPPPVGTGSGPRGTADELAAVADLAAREGVDATAITVVSTDEVTWRDGSMGCPEPGMNYTQSLVPGIRVILELDGVRHEYHAGGARPIFWCAKPQPPAEG